jgi:hypothetical protein
VSFEHPAVSIAVMVGFATTGAWAGAAWTGAAAANDQTRASRPTSFSAFKTVGILHAGTRGSWRLPAARAIT